MDEFATYPNPFYKYTHSSLVSSKTELTLVDGGESHQTNPLFPLIQLARSVGVILVNDNSADTSINFPDGSELYQTYTQAQLAGLTKMPVIPATSTFLSQGLNKRLTFFDVMIRARSRSYMYGIIIIHTFQTRVRLRWSTHQRRRLV